MGRVLGRLVTLVRTVVLARLLAPDDFGLFAIALLGLSVLEAVSQTGFDAALIHRREEETERYLDTAWVVQLVRSSLLAVLLAAVAPVIAAFFREPGATPLLRLVALGLLLRGLTNIGVVYLRKDLDFRKQTVYQLAISLVDLTVSITAALILRNAWALAWGFVAAQLAQAFLSFLIHPYRPRFRFDWSRARALVGYGKWVFSTRILNFIVTSLDTAVVGRMLQAEALGLYNMAGRLSGMAATEVTHVVSQVAFPTFARVREDPARLRTAVARTLGLVSAVSLPIAGVLFVLAPQIVRVVLGDQWDAMIPAFQLLLISGAVRSLTANFGPLFLAVGRPDIQTKASILNASVLALSLVPLVGAFGIMGAVYARLLTLVTQLYTWPRFLALTGIRGRVIVRMLLSPVISLVLAAAAVESLDGGPLGDDLLGLVILAGTGALAYLGSLWLADTVLRSGHRESLRHLMLLLGSNGEARDTPTHGGDPDDDGARGS